MVPPNDQLSVVLGDATPWSHRDGRLEPIVAASWSVAAPRQVCSFGCSYVKKLMGGAVPVRGWAAGAGAEAAGELPLRHADGLLGALAFGDAGGRCRPGVHADYDPRQLWLNYRGFEADWTRRWTQPRPAGHGIPRVRRRGRGSPATERVAVGSVTRGQGAAIPRQERRCAPPVRPCGRCRTLGLALATLAPLLIEPRPLDRRRRHLGEMDEGGLVVAREAPALLVEELDGARARCRRGRSATRRAIPEAGARRGRRGTAGRSGELLAGDPAPSRRSRGRAGRSPRRSSHRTNVAQRLSASGYEAASAPAAGLATATVATQHSAPTSSRACSATSCSISSSESWASRASEASARKLDSWRESSVWRRSSEDRLARLAEPPLDHLERRTGPRGRSRRPRARRARPPPRPRRPPAPTSSASWWATARSSTLSCRPTASRASSYAARSDASVGSRR